MKLRTWCIRIGQILTKTVLVFTGFLVFLTLFCPSTIKAENDRGGITIRHQNVPIEKVFQSIEKQSGYRFFYNETLLKGAVKVTLDLQNASLQDALDACFHNQPLSYAIVDKTIIVKKRPEQQQTSAPIPAGVSFSKPGKIIAVRGKVTSNNTPVAGATVTIKGTDNGTSTDNEGVFSLPEVEENSTLVISSVSHTMREIKLNGQTYIAIDLAKQTDDLDEAVVVAYNTTTVKKNTAAVTVVKGEQIATLPNRSFDKSLQGLVPGLLVTSGTGQPGGGLSNFVLRGIATATEITSGQTVRNPLIVIDGIPVSQDPNQINLVSSTPISNPMAQLNPSDIESISVLKDAAAIALYGSKASNGVIIITTKKGKSGKTTISFQHQTDIASRLKGKIELLNQDEYLELLFEAYKNYSSSYATDAAILADLRSYSATKAPKFPTIVNGPGDTSFYNTPNWFDELYNNHASTISNELSISGGNDKSTFYLNFEYTKQNGIAKKSNFDRKSIRFNFENRPANWLKLGLNTALSYNIQNYSGTGDGTAPLGTPYVVSPLLPVRRLDGTYVLNYTTGLGATQTDALSNPVAAAEYNINRNTSYRGLSKVYAEVSFLKDFKFTTNLGVDFMLTEAKEKVDPRLAVDGVGIGIGKLQDRDMRSANLITTNILRFDKTIKKDHFINVLLGQEAQLLNSKTQYVNVKSLAYPNLDQIINGFTGTLQDYGALTLKQNLLSYFGQANYSFRNKYFFTSSVRRDGSSRFGEDHKYGTYWSTGAGWLVTEERFMKGSASWLNYVKLRGSIGVAGSSASIDRYTRYDPLVVSGYAGNTAVYPNSAVSPGNPDIRWEQTFSWDAGLETRLLNERIIITADVYKRKTSNLVYSITVPFATGFSSYLSNIGDMENKGVELSLSTVIIRKKDFRWKLLANWSTNKNKLVKANVSLSSVGSPILGNEEGRNFNSFYMKRWAGVNDADGKPMWMDSTGTPNVNYNAAKREFVGKPQPDAFGAITNSFFYKDFELTALFYYQYGFQIYEGDALLNDGQLPYINQKKEALNRWQKPGENAVNPRRVLNNTDGGSNVSTRYLFDGDYIRLSNISLAYYIPKRFLDRIHINMLKVYVQGNNLGLWTKYPGQDPGNTNVNGSNLFAYPNQRSFSVGLNLNF